MTVTVFNATANQQGQMFRLRAECYADVEALMALIPREKVLGLWRCQRWDIPDVEVQLHLRRLSVHGLRFFCRAVSDGHVMHQTVQPLHCYTGERDYDLH